jgi:hypothetical protein
MKLYTIGYERTGLQGFIETAIGTEFIIVSVFFSDRHSLDPLRISDFPDTTDLLERCHNSEIIHPDGLKVKKEDREMKNSAMK